MASKEKAISLIREYWKAANKRDFDAIKKVLASDVVRYGPFKDPGDQVSGRDAYVSFIQTIQEKMSAYRNEEHSIFASEDGRRVVLECTEWPTLDETEYEFPLCIIFDINPEWLIKRVNIYWKNPASGQTNTWVRVESNQ